MTMAMAVTALANDGLYAGSVAVSGQGEAERQGALPGALLHVLSKISGQREIPSTPALDEALAQASSMVLAFGYREDPLVLPDGSEQARLQLIANFSPEAVNDVARSLGLQRWRVQRDPVVFWVVIDDRNSRELMPIEYQYEMDGMLETAATRGLPAEWPGLSQELMAQVDVQVLWAGYTDQLVGDGANAGGVAIVAARREGSDWNIRWTYADRTTSTGWRTRNPVLSEALEEGTHRLVDLVASINAIGPAGQGVFRTEVVLADLRSSEDYARSLAYLDRLGLVDDLEVLGVGPSGVRLAVKLNAAPSYFEDILRQDGVLEPGAEPGRYTLVP